MNCPKCDAWSEVLETRKGSQRRRQCANGHRFSTVEVRREDIPTPAQRIESLRGAAVALAHRGLPRTAIALALQITYAQARRLTQAP